VGNNVNVDVETVNLVDVGLRYQLATESMNNKFRLLREGMRRDF
jgi:flagellar basal body rod protein FlgB